MSRAIVALALESGITPSQWMREDEADLVTALDILQREHDRQQQQLKGKAGREVASG